MSDISASVNDATLADQLAERVNRLRPARNDPERFHVERDGIARDLRRLAKRLRGESPRERIHVWRS